ncbi:MAG: cytochrome c-type biogenesis CcmF C-terminal domain-containing protein, partial [Pseudomonadota bacterium]
KAVIGDIGVIKDDKVVRTLHPEKRTYNASGMAMTEAAIDTGLFRDLYVALGEPLANNAWVVRAYHKPFVDWIWLGCLLMAIGGILSVTDRRYRLKITKTSHVAAKTVETENPQEEVPATVTPSVSNPVLATETRKV